MAIFNTIATSVKTVIDGLSLGLTTVIRKDGVVYEIDTLPLVVISLVSDLGEEWATTGNGSTDQGTVGRGFVIGISVYRNNAGALQSNLSDNPDYFQSVKQALNKGSLASATTVWDTRLRQNEQWEGRDFRDGDEVSEFALEFGSAELRNG